MKRNVLFFAGLIALLSLFSCSKDDDPENAFKFDGQEYLINDVYLIEEIFNDGANSEMHVFQFVFGNISGNDTTIFAWQYMMRKQIPSGATILLWALPMMTKG